MESGVLDEQASTGVAKHGFRLDQLPRAGRAVRSFRGTREGLKRAIDVVVSLLGLIILSPLFVLIALAVKLDSRGPMIFSQVRPGLREKPFAIYKFRSMTDATRGTPGRSSDQARVTRVGRLLRASNLDELPQLWNVLWGSMSLVGPRPHPFELDAAYQPFLPMYAARKDVKPGITGWAQVNGFRGTVMSMDVMRDRLEHDLFYIANGNLLMDCKIMVLTVFSPRAYRNAR
jgi:lipopolysaccharide/colanic/teichoic acid biosynthesis glycosyltransferase